MKPKLRHTTTLTFIKLLPMYVHSILAYLSWPALVLVSYFLVRWALRIFEKNLGEEA
jgi:hypothetical protein